MNDTQIPPLTLPSGGTVEFVALDDLTGGDIHDIRAAIRTQDSAGQTTNALMREVFRVAIKTWDIPYLADPRTPEANPAAWRKLKGPDYQALEAALQPVLALLRPPTTDDGTPGSPPQPDSE